VGRLAGLDLPLVARGGKVGEDAGDDVSDNVCGVPVFQLDQPPPDGPIALSLADATTTILCELPDLKAARDITATSWDWQAGQRVELQWSPAGDLARWAGATVAIYHRDATGAVDDMFDAVRVTTTGDTIELTVPVVSSGPSAAPGGYFVQASLVNRVGCSATGATAGAAIVSSLTMFGASHDIALAP
jgi:hypothetical protein